MLLFKQILVYEQFFKTVLSQMIYYVFVAPNDFLAN